MEAREDRFLVEAFDCQPDGFVKPNALMLYLQEAAARHAEQLGVGFADLDRQDCFWVLVNLRIEMTTTPRWRDAVTLRTWPSGFTRLIASRAFVAQDADGRELFRAASEWMILDKAASRPKNLERLNLPLPRTAVQALSTAVSRLRPAEGYTPAGTLTVPFSSLDFNGHVNNTEYVRWAWDALHHRLGRGPVIRSLQMTYTAEVFEGDQIEVLVADQGSPLRALERRAGADAPVFLLELQEDKMGGET